MKYSGEIALKFDFAVDGDNPADSLWDRNTATAADATDVMRAAVNELIAGTDLAAFLEARCNARLEYCSQPNEIVETN